jgi:hypothetical protein
LINNKQTKDVDYCREVRYKRDVIGSMEMINNMLKFYPFRLSQSDSTSINMYGNIYQDLTSTINFSIGPGYSHYKVLEGNDIFKNRVLPSPNPQGKLLLSFPLIRDKPIIPYLQVPVIPLSKPTIQRPYPMSKIDKPITHLIELLMSYEYISFEEVTGLSLDFNDKIYRTYFEGDPIVYTIVGNGEDVILLSSKNRSIFNYIPVNIISVFTYVTDDSADGIRSSVSGNTLCENRRSYTINIDPSSETTYIEDVYQKEYEYLMLTEHRLLVRDIQTIRDIYKYIPYELIKIDHTKLHNHTPDIIVDMDGSKIMLKIDETKLYYYVLYGNITEQQFRAKI